MVWLKSEDGDLINAAHISKIQIEGNDDQDSRIIAYYAAGDYAVLASGNRVQMLARLESMFQELSGPSLGSP